MATLHVAFGLSAGFSLREAFSVDRPEDRVIAFTDTLNVGPIYPLDPHARAEWIAHHLNVDWTDQVANLEDRFWRPIADWPGERIAWFSRHSAKEYANFLEFQERSEGYPFRVVDVTNRPIGVGRPSGAVKEPRLPVAAGLIPGEAIRRCRLVDVAVDPEPAQRQADRECWRDLKSANAAIRIVRGHRLISAEITHFDEVLLRSCSANWTKMALPIAGALSEVFETGFDQVGDLFLASRAFALIATGVLEGRGGLTSIRDSEIRLCDASR